MRVHVAQRYVERQAEFAIAEPQRFFCERLLFRSVRKLCKLSRRRKCRLVHNLRRSSFIRLRGSCAGRFAGAYDAVNRST